MNISTWTIALAAAAALAAQGSNDKSLRGTVTIKANGGAVAIHGTGAAPAGEFLFCVDQDRSAPAERLDFTGPARVLYRVTPIAGIPAGMTISGPESVANTLTVIADAGKVWIFAAKGQDTLIPAGERAPANATRVGTTLVRRLDWATGNGPRRGTDVAGCLAAAG